MSAKLHNHLEVENSILLKPKYETFKHLVDTLQLGEKEVSKIYNVLKNRHVHYGEVYKQLTKSRDNITELHNVQKTSIDLQLQQQMEQQINMERTHIDQLWEEENQWFQHSCSIRDEVHHLA